MCSRLSSLYASRDAPDLHSLPTRRSSDLRRAIPIPWESRHTAVPRSRTSRPSRDAPRRSENSKDEPPFSDLRGASRLGRRSEEHTSELQSLRHLVCRLLLEKKKKDLT